MGTPRVPNDTLRNVQALLRTAIQMHNAALASALLAAGVTLEPHVEPMLPWVWKPPFALDDSAAAPQVTPYRARAAP